MSLFIAWVVAAFRRRDFKKLQKKQNPSDGTEVSADGIQGETLLKMLHATSLSVANCFQTTLCQVWALVLKHPQRWPFISVKSWTIFKHCYKCQTRCFKCAHDLRAHDAATLLTGLSPVSAWMAKHLGPSIPCLFELLFKAGYSYRDIHLCICWMAITMIRGKIFNSLVLSELAIYGCYFTKQTEEGKESSLALIWNHRDGRMQRNQAANWEDYTLLKGSENKWTA